MKMSEKLHNNIVKLDVLQQKHQCQKTNTSTPPKLTDLNVDCLTKLLNHLEINDLVILALANLTDHQNLDQAFTGETTHPYEASIRDRFLQLGYTDYLTNNPYCITFERTVFRYFGQIIPTVRLYYDPHYQRHNANIEQIIMEYGSALTEIDLMNADVCAFEDMGKPFLNVTKLSFKGGWLGQTFCELYKWFPNLKSLSLDCTKISDRKRFIQQVHPNLIELSLKNKQLCQCHLMNRNVMADSELEYVINCLHLRRFLILNSQIEYLSLFHDRADAIFDSDIQPNQFLIQINFYLLQFIANTLPQLCHLKLNITERDLLPSYQTIFNLKSLAVQASQTKRFAQLNITSPDLNHLEITIDSPTQDYEILSEFVGRFKYIESLSIGHHPLNVENDTFVNMIKSLAHLTALRIALYENHFFQDLCFIVKKFDRLTTVRVSCVEIATTRMESFINVANENYFLKMRNWRGSCVCNEFEFKKKC